MARDRNTYAKRQREAGKKQKAADKKARRLKRKENAKGDDGPGDHDRLADEQVGEQPCVAGASQEDKESP